MRVTRPWSRCQSLLERLSIYCDSLPSVSQAVRVWCGKLRGASSGTSMIIEIRVATVTQCLCNNMWSDSWVWGVLAVRSGHVAGLILDSLFPIGKPKFSFVRILRSYFNRFTILLLYIVLSLDLRGTFLRYKRNWEFDNVELLRMSEKLQFSNKLKQTFK